MNEPVSFLAYEPQGPGLMCGVMVIVDGEDIYGWYTGPAGGKFAAAFFMLEHYYSQHETAFYHSVEDDVYSDWVLAYPPIEVDVGHHAPLPEPMCHQLGRAQDAFVAEWLFYCDDPAAAADIEWYRMRSLPLEHAGIRCMKLHRLEEGELAWTYASPALDVNIIDFLRRRWPLNYALAP